jgi:hypothetical protein
VNREPTKSSLDRNDGKMGRRSLLGMTAASLAGSLVACATAPNSSTTSPAPRRRFRGQGRTCQLYDWPDGNTLRGVKILRVKAEQLASICPVPIPMAGEHTRTPECDRARRNHLDGPGP